MSDNEAPAQSSETAEETSTVVDAVSENATAQDGTLTGSDEAINEIADIDDYRNMVGSLKSSTETPATEGIASEDEGENEDENKETTESGKPEENAENQAHVKAEKTEDGEQDGEDQADAGKKPPQYRWRPKSEIDALAMDIIKRSEKSGKETSMKDALVQAETILGGDDSDADNENVANDFPNTVAESEKLLNDLRAQRKQAFARDLDFEKAAELDDQIEAIKDHMGDLKQAEIKTRQDQEAQWNQTLEASKAKAVEMYPDVTNPESELVKKMVEIDAILKESDNELFYAPNKPLKLTQMAANELGIAPNKSGVITAAKPTASSQPVKVTSPAVTRPFQPASGTARTTKQSNQNGQSAVELDKVTDEDSWREAMSKLKAAAVA